MTEVFKEIRRLQAETPANAEAAGMKTYAGTYLLIRMTSADLICASSCAPTCSVLPGDYFSSYVQRAMAVGPEQITALTARQLPVDKLVMVAVGDMKIVEPQLLALPELKGRSDRAGDPAPNPDRSR